MEVCPSLYDNVCYLKNLILAWRKARKGKTKMDYVIEFESNLRENLLQLRKELKKKLYKELAEKEFLNEKKFEIMESEMSKVLNEFEL